MEQSLAPMEVLTAFLIGDWWMPWDTQDFSPSIQVSIQAWRFLLSHSTTKSSKMEYQLPIEAIEAKIPMLSAKLFPNYSIDTLWDFLSNSGPKSVKQLVTKFCLPRNLHFPIAHIYIYTVYMRTHPIPELYLPHKIWQFYFSQKPNTKGILLFYNHIQEMRIFRKSTTLNKWQSELNLTFTEDQWKAAFREIAKASHCVNHWGMILRIYNRWQYTPHRLAKVFPDTPPPCWCNVGRQATSYAPLGDAQALNVFETKFSD